MSVPDIVQDLGFYEVKRVVCPICREELKLVPRESQPEFMKYVHPKNECRRSEQEYYAPSFGLSPMDPQFR